MKTFKELANGDVLYIYFIDSIIEFLITKVEKYPYPAGTALRFSGLINNLTLEVSWTIQPKDINSTLTEDTAITIELAKQHQSKLVYKGNIVRRRVQRRYQEEEFNEDIEEKHQTDNHENI